jgi:hypothetical protein
MEISFKKVEIKVKFWKVAKVYAIGMFISNLTHSKLVNQFALFS